MFIFVYFFPQTNSFVLFIFQSFWARFSSVSIFVPFSKKLSVPVPVSLYHNICVECYNCGIKGKWTKEYGDEAWMTENWTVTGEHGEGTIFVPTNYIILWITTFSTIWYCCVTRPHLCYCIPLCCSEVWQEIGWPHVWGKNPLKDR